MSDQKTVTEREAVKRERAAFLKGRERVHLSCIAPTGCGVCRGDAATAYPLPKVEQTREVRDTTGQNLIIWRVVDGHLQARFPRLDDRWRTDQSTVMTPARVNLLAALLANPTELVEDEPDMGSSR